MVLFMEKGYTLQMTLDSLVGIQKEKEKKNI